MRQWRMAHFKADEGRIPSGRRAVEQPPLVQPGEVRELDQTIHPGLVPHFNKLRAEWLEKHGERGVV